MLSLKERNADDLNPQGGRAAQLGAIAGFGSTSTLQNGAGHETAWTILAG